MTRIAEEDLVKTMLYKGQKKDGQLFSFCVLVSGSDGVNPDKLKKELHLETLEKLSKREVFELTGASSGSCGPVGLKCPIYMDKMLKDKCNYMVGANETAFI